MGVEFRVLGPLEVLSDGSALPVSSGRQRTVLAALLLSANQVVAVDELADVLWGPALPSSARVAVQNYVKRLRDGLGDAGLRILTQFPGYLIRVAVDELDVSMFEASLGAARQARQAGSWQKAADQARAALSMWRGEPLADVRSEALALRHVPWLAELRMEAAEIGIEAAIGLGSCAEVIGELGQLVAAHPLRERLRALLMLALYGDGRKAEALAAYQSAREILVAELGAEPGPELRELQRKILAGDLSLAGGPAPAGRINGAAGAAAAVPRELPARVRHFTGRGSELAFLSRQLEQRRDGEFALVISAIGGTGGVGKTALAVVWAHQVAALFPDGQLYVNLRGYDPDRPVAEADALAGFLRSLGVPGADVPQEADERARLYRSKLAGRRMLVLLDNARDADHVRPLLPGDPGCVAVVTSRDTLAGLVAREGAQRLDLDLLPLDDAVRLLRSLIGARVDADPEAAAALAGQCARLPLALRIAAQLAAARQPTPLRDLVTELAGISGPLDRLDAGEERANVRAVFSWSYRQLSAAPARAFRLIGLHPGEDLDVHAAAALTGTTTGQAGKMLSQLSRGSLIQVSGNGRYSLHDLLRAYAREQAAACDGDDQCRESLTGLFDYYLCAAAAAMDMLFPAEAHRRPLISPAAAVLPPLPGQAEARAWLDQERANLVRVVVHCAGHGWPGHAARLAATLFRYLITGSHLPEGLTIYGQARHAAERSGDLAAEAEARNGLGGIGIRQGRFGDAACHYRAALECYRQCGDREGEARVLHNLGITEKNLNNLRSAADYYLEAIAAYSDAGDHLGRARALSSLGGVEAELDRYDQASEHLQVALQALRDAGDQRHEAEALRGMGSLNLRRGRLTQAAGFFEQALTLFRSIGQPTAVASALWDLGGVCLRQSEYRRAIGYLQQALVLCGEGGNQFGELLALRRLAEALHGVGQPGAARAALESALRLATETGNAYQQASSHRDLAENHHSAGNGEQARQHWQQALILFTGLGDPEADQVRARLENPGPYG
jgi:DNA-binding SARP family transcriptional activator